MSDTTDLKGWPSSVNAIDWSEDGVIAVAMGKSVQLMCPKFKAPALAESTVSFDPTLEELDTPRWKCFNVQMSEFAPREQIFQIPAPSRMYSAGEEMTEATVVDLAWSPSGIAEYRRPALAVHTSNLVLSLWSSEGDFRDSSAWERSLTVNRTLNEYFGLEAEDDPTRLANTADERRRLRQRIRAFAWCPGTYATASNIVGPQADWDPCYLAVSNEDNQIVLLSIRSPYWGFPPGYPWAAKVLAHFDVGDFSASNDSDLPEIETFDFIMNDQRYISHLAWSPRINRGEEGFQHILAYSTNKDIRTSIVRFKRDDGSDLTLEEEYVCHEAEIGLAGQMKWCPAPDEEGNMLLFIFSQDEVACLWISSSDGSVVRTATHDLEDRWDEISGIVFDVRTPGNFTVHFSSILSTTRLTTTALSITASGLSPLPPQKFPAWRTQIQESQAFYSITNDLEGEYFTELENPNVLALIDIGNTMVRTWGLATSPLGDNVAACYSLHPANQIEYQLSVSKVATIAVSRFAGSAKELTLANKTVGAEPVFMRLRQWYMDNIDTKEDIAAGKPVLLQVLLKHFGGDPSINESLSYDSLTPENMIKLCRKKIYHNKNNLQDRYNFLINRVFSPEEDNTFQRMMIITRVRDEVERLSQAACADDWLSHRTRTMLSTAAEFIYKIAGKPWTGGNPHPDDSPREICGICQEAIEFEEFLHARCKKGHEYVRCGLSQLAIQQADITKNCVVCSKPYLSEAYVKDASNVDGEFKEIKRREEDPESGLSLAKIVFAACDACIYCGGKFV